MAIGRAITGLIEGQSAALILLSRRWNGFEQVVASILLAVAELVEIRVGGGGKRVGITALLGIDTFEGERLLQQLLLRFVTTSLLQITLIRWQRDGRENADNRHGDQQLDQTKPPAMGPCLTVVHLSSLASVVIGRPWAADVMT